MKVKNDFAGRREERTVEGEEGEKSEQQRQQQHQ